MNIEQIITQPQHHAYIAFGYTPEELHAMKRCEGLYVIQTDTALGVDEVRELHEYAFQRADAEERKIVLSTPNISFQAQNALLKLMEETGEGTYFFLCVPQGTEILNTLLSRCYLIDKGVAHAHALSEQFEAFIAATAKERLAMIEKIWDQGESVRHGAILRLLQDFEKYIHRCIVTDGESSGDVVGRYRRVTQNLRDAVYKGALHKATLQALAFV